MKLEKSEYANISNQLKEGDIIKKDLRSRQSWTVINVDGKLMASPNPNSIFPDTTVIELQDEYYKIAEFCGSINKK